MSDSPERDASNPNDLGPGKRKGGRRPHSRVKRLGREGHRLPRLALSENTRKAYQRGWEDFLSFCREHGFEATPATEQAVALYLSDRAEDLGPSTLSQRIAAIQHAHDERGLSSPTRSKSVQNVMRGIRRESDRSPEQAPPLLTEHVKDMVDALPGNGKPPEGTEAEAAWLRGKRDRALVLTGFAGAFRRSELAALRMEHIDSRPDGLLVTVPESKTDQEGEGQLVAIRRIEGSGYCPVKALREWMAAAQIEEGAVFRGMPRSGYISREAITGRTVGNAVKRAAETAGLPQAKDYTGHSLRAGHITQASMEGRRTRRFRPRAATRTTGRSGSTSARRSFWKTPPVPIWGCSAFSGPSHSISHSHSHFRLQSLNMSESEQETSTLRLPESKSTGESSIHREQNVVVLGANGSGKSRLGAWIEDQAPRRVHRISAQKSLSMPESVQPTAIEEAEKELLIGYTDFDLDEVAPQQINNYKGSSQISCVTPLTRQGWLKSAIG